MTTTDTDPEPAGSRPIVPDDVFDAPVPTTVEVEPEEVTPRRKRRRGTTKRSFIISMVFASVAAFGPMDLTGSTKIDLIERFLIVAVVTYVGSHAHRWAWFASGALIALVLRDIPLLVTLLGILTAVGSTRLDHRAKDIGAIAIGLMCCAVFWSAGHNVGGWTAAAVVVAFLVLVLSGLPNMKRRQRKYFRWGLLAVLIFTLAVTALAAYGVYGAVPDVQSGTENANKALAAVRLGDTETARGPLAAAQRNLKKAEGSVSSLTRPASLVPGLAQQLGATTTSISQARAITDAASTMVERNYHHLRYEGAIDVNGVRAFKEPTRDVAAVVADADAAVSGIQGMWLLPPLATHVDQFSQQIQEVRADTDMAADALNVLPDLLGGNGRRKYLVAFITPAELRGAGGFIGSYAEITADNGNVRVAKSGRIADLITAVPEGTRQLNGPEDYVDRYGRFQPEDFLQDITYSPNWPSDAAVFADLYTQTTGVEIHGVLAVDPKGLAALLELIGEPVQVPGLPVPLQASNAVELLTRQQYLQFADRAEREEVLAAATRATFEKLVDADLPAPETIGKVLGPATRGRHIQMWSPVFDEEKLFKRLHADGTLDIPVGSDGFSVVQQNVGNNKIDAYLQRTIDYDITVDAADGSMSGTMIVTLENKAPSLDYPDAVVANRRGAPRGSNVASVAIHAPWVVRWASIDDVEEVLGQGTEAGLNAWDTPVLTIPPGGKVALVMEIEGIVDLSDGYHLRILPQPVANADNLNVKVHLENGTFGEPEADLPDMELTASAQDLQLSGRLERTVDIEVPATR